MAVRVGGDTVNLAPALVAEEAQIEEMVSILRQTLLELG